MDKESSIEYTWLKEIADSRQKVHVNGVRPSNMMSIPELRYHVDEEVEFVVIVSAN